MWNSPFLSFWRRKNLIKRLSLRGFFLRQNDKKALKRIKKTLNLITLRSMWQKNSLLYIHNWYNFKVLYVNLLVDNLIFLDLLGIVYLRLCRLIKCLFWNKVKLLSKENTKICWMKKACIMQCGDNKLGKGSSFFSINLN